MPRSTGGYADKLITESASRYQIERVILPALALQAGDPTYGAGWAAARDHVQGYLAGFAAIDAYADRQVFELVNSAISPFNTPTAVYRMAVNGEVNAGNIATVTLSVIGAGFAGRAATVGGKVAVGEARGGVYVLRDPATGGNVVRSGRTINLTQREAQHLRDPALKNFDFDPIYRTDVYNEQRGLEQILHDTYQPALNIIRPISPNNRNYNAYMEAARKYLGN